MRFAMLLLAIMLGLVPLAGIGWIVATRSITTVDGLFMSLILLTLSGIFFLNAALEVRALGYLTFLQKKKSESPKAPPASKAG